MLATIFLVRPKTKAEPKPKTKTKNKNRKLIEEWSKEIKLNPLYFTILVNNPSRAKTKPKPIPQYKEGNNFLVVKPREEKFCFSTLLINQIVGPNQSKGFR